jgi:hypothetical protein
MKTCCSSIEYSTLQKIGGVLKQESKLILRSDRTARSSETLIHATGFFSALAAARSSSRSHYPLDALRPDGYTGTEYHFMAEAGIIMYREEC